MPLSTLALSLSISLGTAGGILIVGVLFTVYRRKARHSDKGDLSLIEEAGSCKVSQSSRYVVKKHEAAVASLIIPPERIKGRSPQTSNATFFPGVVATPDSPQSSLKSAHWTVSPLPSPSPTYRDFKAASSSSSVKKLPHISPPTLVVDLTTTAKRESGVVSSPFGISLSPILPSPNPRTVSFNAKVSRTSLSTPGAIFPRNMIVCTTFTATREDEMFIAVGERLRLLEIYEDQWCLVQRIRHGKGELGVIPTFCLAEPLQPT